LPYVKQTGAESARTPTYCQAVVKKVKAETTVPLIVKLSPNVADIVVFAKAAVEAGADVLTAVNTPESLGNRCRNK
jgi:dihydroorotate dehydrogenase (NAD+) catalytic subunit